MFVLLNPYEVPYRLIEVSRVLIFAFVDKLSLMKLLESLLRKRIEVSNDLARLKLSSMLLVEPHESIGCSISTDEVV